MAAILNELWHWSSTGTFLQSPPLTNSLGHSIRNVLDLPFPVIIVGDLNDDLLNRRFFQLRNLMNTCSLYCVIDQPTRVTGSSATLLDPILNIVSGSLVVQILRELSDHDAVSVFLKNISVKNNA
jgi:hypothetical protein